MKHFSKAFFILLVFALIIRVVLVVSTSQRLKEHGDMYLHRDWGRVAFLYGPADTYSEDHISDVGIVNNLPPGATYLFGSSYYTSIQASKVVFKVMNRPEGTYLWTNDGTFASMFLKLPATVADLVIGALIFVIVSKLNKKYALLSASLYLFNPITIYNSAVWGQFDAVPTMFFMLALFFLTSRHYFLSVLGVFLSLYIKFSMLPLLPLYFIILFLTGARKKVILSIVGAIAVILLITLPISRKPVQWLFDYTIHNGAGKNSNVTSNVYNFWWLVIAPKINSITVSAGDTFFITSYLVWGYILFGIFFGPLVYGVWKIKDTILKPEYLYGFFAAVAFIFYIFLATMHERYLFPLFPLLAIFVGLRKEYVWIFFAVSTIHFINLISVWQYIPLPGQVNDVFLSQIFSWVMSLCLVTIGLLFYTKILKQYVLKK